MLVLVAVGGLVTWVLTRPRVAAPTEARAWVGVLQPDLVKTVKVVWPQGGQAEFTRLPAGDEWLMRLRDEPAWPVPPTRVRAALRLIGEASGPSGPTTIDKNESTDVVITDEAGTSRAVRVGRAALGGRVPLVVEGGGSILADADLAKIFQPEGVAAWGEPTLLMGFGEPSAVELDVSDAKVTLSRTQTRWSLLSPLLARCDATACRSVVQRWGEVQGVRWLGGTASDDMGFAKPQAAVSVSTEVRAAGPGGEVSKWLVIQRLELGAIAGSGQRYARVGGMVERDGDKSQGVSWGPRVAIISDADAGAFDVKPGSLLSRRAMDATGADIRYVSVIRGDEAAGALSATRGIDGWKSGDVPLSSTDGAGVAGLIKMLCETDAATAVTDTPSGVKKAATLRLGASKDASVELTLSRAQVPLKEGNQPVLLVSDGKVTWIYPEGAWAELSAWIGR